jgi:hypothetical protein
MDQGATPRGGWLQGEVSARVPLRAARRGAARAPSVAAPSTAAPAAAAAAR